jgi:hypothetical protein
MLFETLLALFEDYCIDNNYTLEDKIVILKTLQEKIKKIIDKIN